jgi:hypothetical protein
MTEARDAILAARRGKTILAPLGAAAPVDETAGYAVQRAVAEALGAIPPAGFKIGATAKGMQAYLGLSRAWRYRAVRRLRGTRGGMRSRRAARPRSACGTVHGG